MASLVRQPTGHKLIQIRSGDGQRQTIRLGKVDVKQAEAVLAKIETIVNANLTGVAFDGEVSRWLASIDDRLYERMAGIGLVKPRETVRTTVGGLLDTFFATLAVKASTATTYKQARRSLEDYFGHTRALTAITALDGDRFRQALKAEGLAEATISKRIKVSRQIFKQAVRWKMITENPFAEVKAGVQTNKSRMFFITRDVIEKVLDACPDAEWRTIIALSRFGGLRCPSEHLTLRWQDIDWARGRVTVWSSKTEGIEGREFRQVPLFPELRVHLQARYEQAADGAEFVITRYRDTSTNLRTRLLWILARAGVTPWEKVFHNMRSSRQTELTEEYPTHVVCAWLGNSPAVAQAHYLQVRDQHFEAAAGLKRGSALQNALQHGAELARTASQPPFGEVA
jgi:integrase